MVIVPYSEFSRWTMLQPAPYGSTEERTGRDAVATTTGGEGVHGSTALVTASYHELLVLVVVSEAGTAVATTFGLVRDVIATAPPTGAGLVAFSDCSPSANLKYSASNDCSKFSVSPRMVAS